MNELWKALGAETGANTCDKSLLTVKCCCACEGHGIASEDFGHHWYIDFPEIPYHSWDYKKGWEKENTLSCMYLKGRTFNDAKSQALVFLKWWNKPHGKRSRRTITMSEHSCWGDSIGWLDWNKRLLTGHMGGRNMPKVGDIIRTDLGSGKIGLLRVIEVRPCDNPKDQFFAKAEDIGYEETEDKK